MFDNHRFFISLEYQSVGNFAASDSNDLMFEEVTTFSISQETNMMRIRSQLK
jgi:hypothetical protein